MNAPTIGPGSSSDTMICDGQTIPTLTVSVGVGETADWYDAMTDGTLLLSGSTSYTPTMAGTYYAEARIIISGCVSSTRTPLTLTINPQPDITGRDTSICLGETVDLSTLIDGTVLGALAYDTILGSFSLSNPVSPTSTTTYIVRDSVAATMCVDTAMITVTVNPLPNVNIDIPSSICNGDSLMLNEDGGDAVTWLWSSDMSAVFTDNTAQNPKATNVTNGEIFKVVVTSSDGCVDSTTASITVHPLPSVSPTAASICAGDSLQLNEVGGDATTWLWSSNGSATFSDNTSQNPKAANAVNNEMFYVQVTDGNGCSQIDSVQANVNPLPQPIPTITSPICEGETVTLNESANSGISYAWSTDGPSIITPPGAQSPTASGVVNNETFTVVVTDGNNCVDSASIMAVVNPLPVCNIPTPADICSGDTLFLLENGGDATSWAWTTTGGAMLFDTNTSSPYALNVNDGDVFKVVIENGFNCIDSCTVSVGVFPEAMAAASTGGDICIGDSLQLSETGGDAMTWLWTTTGSAVFNNNSIQNPSVSGAMDNDTFQVIITNANGCIDTAIAVATVHPLPTVIPTMSDTICLGDTLYLDEIGGDAASWSWTTSGLGTFTNSNIQSPAFIGAADGDTIKVVATTIPGCIDSAIVIAKVNPLPVAVVDPLMDICQDDTLQLNESSGLAVAWLWTSDSSAIFSDSSLQNPLAFNVGHSETFQVLITDANGCQDTAFTSSATVNPPVCNATATGPSCLGDTVFLSENGGFGISWNWTTSGSAIIDDPSSQNTFATNVSDNDVFTVLIMDGTGCSDTCSVMAEVNPLPTVTPTATSPICVDQVLGLDEEGGSATMWEWKSNGSSVFSNRFIKNPSVTGFVDNEIFTVIVEDMNGCIDSNTVQIEVFDLPTPNPISGSDSLCVVSSSQVYTVMTDRSATHDYQWSLPDGGGVINGSDSSATVTIDWQIFEGNFRVLVFETNKTTGCTYSNEYMIELYGCSELELNKVVDSTYVSIGDTVNFQIVIRNNGPGRATNVEVVDSLPLGFDYESDNGGTQGTTAQNANEIIWSVGTLDSMEVDTLLITALVNSNGLYCNEAEITASDQFDFNSTPGNDVLSENDQDTAKVYPIFAYDLALIKTLTSVGPFQPGDTLSFDVIVYNQGEVTARDIIVEDYVPTDMSFVPGGDFTEVATDSVIATLPIIDPAEADTVSLDLRIDPLFQGQFINNLAEIIEDDGDDEDSTPDSQGIVGIDNDTTATLNGVDDYDGELVTVEQIFDLALKQVVINGPTSGLAPGDTVEYEIVVYNQGTLDATDVVVKDYLPSMMDFVSSPDFELSGGMYLDTVSNLPAGSSDTLTIQLSIDGLFMGDSLVNNAEIIDANNALSQSDQDSTLGMFGSIDDQSELDTDNDINDEPDNPNDADQYDPALVTINQVFDLALKQEVIGATTGLKPGDTVLYEIVVFNQGTISATDVVVKDYLPTNMTFVSSPDFALSGGMYLDTIPSLIAGSSDTLTISLKIDDLFMGDSLVNNAEIIDAVNGSGEMDQDSILGMFGSIDDTSELDTDNDISDDSNGGADNPNDADQYDPALVVVEQEFDLALKQEVINGPTTGLSPGDTVEYEIVIYNQGTLDATDVVIKNYLPSAMTFISSPDFVLDGGMYLDTIANLGVGQTDTINITLRINPTFMGDSLVNNAEIIDANNIAGAMDQDSTLGMFGSSDDVSELDTDNDINDNPDNPADADQYDPAKVTLTQTYDLALIKELADSGPFAPGDTVSYNITVYNQGTLDAATVIIEDSLPAGMSLVPGGDFVMAGIDSVISIIPNVLSGGDVTRSIDLEISPSFQGTSLLNTAEIIVDSGDDEDSTPDTGGPTGPNDDTTLTDGTDDIDPEVITVVQEFDLALKQEVINGPISGLMQGDTVEYEIVVYNQGTLDATEVVIKDYLPDSMTFVDSPDFVLDGGMYLDTIASLPAGQSDTVTIRLSINNGFMQDSLVNNAEIISAMNALAQMDQDSTLGMFGSSDDESELDTDNDINDNPDNPADADQYDPALVTLTQSYDLALIKQLTETGPFAPGDTVSYVIRVYNQGSLTANGVVVEDSIPSEMTLLTGGDFTEVAPDSVVAVIPTIVAGGEDSVMIDLIIDPTFQGTSITNTAEIAEDDGDDNDSTPDTGGPTGPNDDTTLTDGTDDIDPEVITVVQEFDLALKQEVINGPISGLMQGDTVEYEIVVYNQGTLDATEVVIKDYLPDSMTFVDSPDFVLDGGMYLDTIASLPAGQSDTVTIRLSINNGFMQDSLVNNAEIISAMNALAQMDQDSTLGMFGSSDDESELDTDNDINDNPDNPADADQYDPALVTLTQSYDLALIKQLTETGPFAPGDTVSYVIRVYNQGSLTANGVVVEDSIPSEMTLLTGGDFTEVAPDSVVAVIPTIVAGGEDSVMIDLIIDPTFQGTSITNTAEIAEDDGDDNDSTPDTGGPTGPNDDTTLTDGTDDIDPEVITVVQEFDLALKQEVINGPISGLMQGDTVEYEIVVYNQGSLDATEVVIKDYLPDSMTFVDSPDFVLDGGMYLDTIASLPAGQSDTVTIRLSINNGFMQDSLVNNAEIISAMNALAQMDQDSTLGMFGSSDDESELDTDNDINDNPDNPADADQYDPALVTLTQSYDLALIKQLTETGPFAPGDTVSYVIRVYNQGSLTANGVVVEDSIPSEMTLLTGGDFTEVAPDSVVAVIPTIVAGGEDSVMIDLIIDPTFQGTSITNTAEIAEDDGDDNDSTPDTGGPTGPNDDTTLTDGTDDIDPEVITVVQEFDLALKQEVINGPISGLMQGDTVEYEIVVYNQGSLDATEVVIKDYLPDSMTFVDSPDFVLDGGMYLDTIASLPAGQSDTVTIRLSINNGFMQDSLVNNAEIISAMNALAQMDQDSTLGMFGSSDDESELDTDNDINDNPDNPNDADQYDPALVTLTQSYDLALIKELDESGPFYPSDTVTYKITVFNQGSLSASSIEVQDTLFTGMSLVSGGVFVANGPTTVSTTIGSIAPGSNEEVFIDLRIDPSFQGNMLNNIAEIISDDGDDTDSDPDITTVLGPDDDTAATDGTDDIDGEIIAVQQEFDLALKQEVVGGPTTGLSQGDTVMYEIVVYNQGTLDADDVVVENYIPTGMTFLSSPHFVNDGGMYLDTIPSLLAGDSITISLKLTIDPTFQGDSLINNAEITDANNALGQIDQDSTLGMFGTNDDTSELDTDNDVNDNPDNPNDADQYDPALVTVAQTYDLALIKVVDESGPFEPGDTVSFKIYVYNQGTLNASNIVVEDSIPTGTTLLTGGDFTEVTPDSVVASIPTLLAGETDSLSIDLIIDSDFQGTSITNMAEIVEDDGDDVDSSPDTGGDPGVDDDIDELGDKDDRDPAVIAVVQEFDLALKQEVINGPTSGLTQGDTVEYEIVIYNQGSLNATDVVVKDYIPTGMNFVSSP